MIPDAAAQTRRAALLVFALALVLRIAMALWLPGEVIWEDGHRYVKVAQNLLTTGGFGDIADNRSSVPTQPLLIAGVEAVFGQNFTAVRVVSAVIGAITCLLAYLLARRLLSPRAALLAGIGIAGYPFLVYLSALFEYPQPLFLLLMTAFFCLLYASLQSGRQWLLAVAGLILGTAILTVPTALIFAGMLVPALWSGTVGGTLRRAAIVLVAAALPVAAWTARNQAAYGEVILVNKAAGLNFWLANNETYYELGKRGVIPPCGLNNEYVGKTQMCREWYEIGIAIGGDELSAKEKVDRHEAAGWFYGLRFVRTYPSHFIQLIGVKFLNFWSPTPDAVNEGEGRGGRLQSIVAWISYTPVLILGLFGIVLTARAWRKWLPIYAYFIAMVAPYCIFLPTTRYRLPLDLFLLFFAAYAVDWMLDRFRRRSTPAAAPSAG